MKSVLISIQPKWVELIASGEKTIEVRKTRPKLETPFKCYIYCTKDKPYLYRIDDDDNFELVNKLRKEEDCYVKYYGCQNGKVIGEFICDRVYDIKRISFETYSSNWNYEDKCCLTFQEIKDYLGNEQGYGWHISNLKIYDKPKELSEFGQKCDMAYEIRCRDCLIRKGWNECCEVMCKPLTRPPQSWCYVEIGE